MHHTMAPCSTYHCAIVDAARTIASDIAYVHSSPHCALQDFRFDPGRAYEITRGRAVSMLSSMMVMVMIMVMTAVLMMMTMVMRINL